MGFLLQLVSRNEIAGVTEVSDELRERPTGAGVRIETRIGELTGTDAASVLGLRCGDSGGDLR